MAVHVRSLSRCSAPCPTGYRTPLQRPARASGQRGPRPLRGAALPSSPLEIALADGLALGRELDRVGRRAADGLVAPELRGGIGLRPGRHLLDEVQVVIAEIRADEALVPCPRGDLADAL